MVNPQYSWDMFKKNESQPIDNGLYKDEKIQENIPQKKISTDIESQKQDNYSWGSFKNTSTYQGEPDPTKDESTFGYWTRNILSNAARLFESFNPVARVGNTQEFFQNGLSKYPEAGGILGKAIHGLIGQEKWDQMIYGNPALSPKIPTSQDLKNITDTATSGYTKPKTKNEKRTQEFFSDVGSTLSGRPTSARNILVNNLGIPAASNVAKEVVNELGFGDDKGTWTKLAAWTGLSLLSNVNAPAYAANLMNQGRQGYNQNVTANIPRYENRINQASRNMLQGDPRSSLAQQQLAGVRNDIANGQTSMADLMNRYDAINAAKRDRGLFQLGRNDRRAAIRNINQVRDAVRGEIETIGRSNPQALQSWQNGVQAFAVIHQSNAMTNWIQSTAKGPYAKILTAPVAGLFGLGGKAAHQAPFIGMSTSAAVPALHKGGQVAYRVWNDPSLARYYWDALNAARQENQNAFIKSFNSLNKEYEKKHKD